jgi:hypothetical protein
MGGRLSNAVQCFKCLGLPLPCMTDGLASPSHGTETFNHRTATANPPYDWTAQRVTLKAEEHQK